MSVTTSKKDLSDITALVAKVASLAEIQDVRLIECVVRQKLLNDKLPTSLRYGFEATAVLPLKEIETDNGKEYRLLVNVRFELIGAYEENDPERERLRIEAAFRLIYTLPSREGIGDEHLRAFGRLNGVYNAFPFWREFAQSLSARMGLPPLTVPLFKPFSRIGKLEKKAHAEKQ